MYYQINFIDTVSSPSGGAGVASDIFAVDLEPLHAATAVADLLCDRGCDVTEVRLLRQAGQAKVLVRFPHHPDNAARLADHMRHAWAALVLRAAAGEGPLAMEN